jgi:hypothetical protein
MIGVLLRGLGIWLFKGRTVDEEVVVIAVTAVMVLKKVYFRNTRADS